MRNQSFRVDLLKDRAAGAVSMSCREAGCANFEHGWLTVLDPGNENHRTVAGWIKDYSGRRFYELRSEGALDRLEALEDRGDLRLTPELRAMLGRTAPGLLVFLFPPGQQCFQPHVDREVVFRHNRYVHARPTDWVEDFNEQADKIATLRRRG